MDSEPTVADRRCIKRTMIIQVMTTRTANNHSLRTNLIVDRPIGWLDAMEQAIQFPTTIARTTAALRPGLPSISYRWSPAWGIIWVVPKTVF